MTLKNKDGTPYSLEKPNPLRVGMSTWDKSKVVMHNKVGSTVTIPAETKQPVKEQLRSERPRRTVEQPEPEVVESLEEDNYMSEPERGGSGVPVWCLPAYIKEVVDPLYNEKYTRVKYGKKFTFQCTLVEMADISMVLWTDTKAVTQGSIIYPKVNDKRWWRVESVKEDEQTGYLLYCVITDYQPNFSE